MADQNFMDLASKTASGITGTDYMMLVNNSEAYKALVNDVAEAILGKLTSKSFSGLETTAKNVIGALNELNSKSQNIAERFYMITINTEDHSTVKIKFNNTIRNFMLIFGSANQSPYLGIADLKGIQRISDVSGVVNIQRDAEQSDLYIITCPTWSTFFIIGDARYLKDASISYS